MMNHNAAMPGAQSHGNQRTVGVPGARDIAALPAGRIQASGTKQCVYGLRQLHE